MGFGLCTTNTCTTFQSSAIKPKHLQSSHHVKGYRPWLTRPWTRPLEMLFFKTILSSVQHNGEEFNNEMDDGHIARSGSFGHDITPDEERLHLVTQEGSFNNTIPVEVIRDVTYNEDGRMDVAYESAVISRRHIFEPLDETPPDPHQFGVSNRFYSERNRLKTFNGQWLDSFPVRPSDLARDGLYYVGPGDCVKCAFCSKTLRDWEPGDQVEVEHRKHYPSCPFVRGLCEDQNIPISEVQAVKRSMGVKVKMFEAAVLDKAKMADRLKTFHNWPFPETVSPMKLAAAGLFYTGQRDAVKCFACGKVLTDWEPGDDPFTEHAKFYPQCSFVKMNFGRSQEGGSDLAGGATSNAYGGKSSPSPSENGHAMSHSGSEKEQLHYGVQASTSSSVSPACATTSSNTDQDLLQTSAAQAVMQTLAMSPDQLIPILQALRLEKGPEARISVQDIMKRIDDVDGRISLSKRT